MRLPAYVRARRRGVYIGMFNDIIVARILREDKLLRASHYGMSPEELQAEVKSKVL